MPSPEVLRVGGRQYNWNSCITRVDGSLWQGFTGLDWGEKLDVETVYSQTQNGVPLGDTGGQYAVESLTIKMLTEYWEQLKLYLANQAPGINGERGPIGSYGQTKFALQFTVYEPTLPGAFPIHIDAAPCRVIAPKGSAAKGNASLESEIALWCQQLTINGLTLYTPSPIQG
jgi:hypothetical protein